MFSEWPNRNNQNFTSPEIQNKILTEMSLSILRDIVESIKNAGFYSIMADETSEHQTTDQFLGSLMIF